MCGGMELSGGEGGGGEGVRVFVRVCVRAGTATLHVTSKFVWGKLYFCFATTGAFLWIFAPAQVAHKQQCSACCSVGVLLVGLQRHGALVGGYVVFFPVVLCVGVVATMSGGGRLLPPCSCSCYRGLLSFTRLRYIYSHIPGHPACRG